MSSDEPPSSSGSRYSSQAPGLLEASSASLLGFLLSSSEYSTIYKALILKKKSQSAEQQIQEPQTESPQTTPRKIKISAKELARILFPRPEVVENLNEDLPSENDEDSNDSPLSLPQAKKTIRSHTRLFLKSYLIIVTIKSLQQLRSKKKNALLRSVLVLKDKFGADVSLSLTAIAFSYKIIYGFLVFLKPVMKDFIGIFIHDKSILSEILYEYAHAIIPLISGITAGSFLRIYPQLNAGRDLVAVYALVRSLEFVYNYLDDNGYLVAVKKPKLIGSWALFPFAYAQLFHSFFFNREANSNFVNSTMFTISKDFFTLPPNGYPKRAKWPSPPQIVDSIAQIAKSHYPKFISTLMFSNSAPIPSYLDSVKPIIIRAHPAINTMTGALLHPWEPSQFRALANIVLRQYTSIGKYVFALYLFKAFLVKKIVSEVEPDPDAQKSTDTTSTQVILTRLRLFLATIFNAWRTTTFIIMTSVSSWAGIEFAQAILSNKFIPVYRFKIIGFLSGLWAIFDKVSGRGRYIYAVRAAVLSYWRVLVKEKRVKPIRNGDVYVFALAFGLTMSLFEISPGSISGPAIRKALNWVGSGSFTDPVEKKTGKKKKKVVLPQLPAAGFPSC